MKLKRGTHLKNKGSNFFFSGLKRMNDQIEKAIEWKIKERKENPLDGKI